MQTTSQATNQAIKPPIKHSLTPTWLQAQAIGVTRCQVGVTSAVAIAVASLFAGLRLWLVLRVLALNGWSYGQCRLCLHAWVFVHVVCY